MSLRKDIQYEFSKRMLYKDPRRAAQFERIKARMLADGRRLEEIEFAYCLQLARSKQKLKNLDNPHRLFLRIRYLARELGEKVSDHTLRLVCREQCVRDGRQHVQQLRCYLQKDVTYPMGVRQDLNPLLAKIREGNLSLKNVGTTAREMSLFKEKARKGKAEEIRHRT
ncbi:hypothetical protein A2765_02825 [Candidatus Kaiserbacteria bacterium RIFCSPHIGHO2_01_FULL_56_24]|uniref:Uncharacterized protein n=1 Tax=Candidatus Kaiserbacteria bacterium RIFCSPHIGHO2_01_FULL_56_24 TaxID=1798487 RepID=A0A1F6DC94_9BACT|nr:MAG: hypothetical protein A2765_02825 [Candidatus Kaiserbacteria bacterium RIFCSPHIGHO2_01_FULL_56_24]